MDKEDFMDIANDMRKGLTPRLAKEINNMDTEPREKIAMIMKKHVGQKETEYSITNQFLSLLEKQIYKDPSQYFWTHNRFKHLLT